MRVPPAGAERSAGLALHALDPPYRYRTGASAPSDRNRRWRRRCRPRRMC